MNRNIRVEGLSTRVREDGVTGSVLSAPVGDGCVTADTVEGNGTVRVSRGQTIVRVRYDDEGGISEVAVNDEVVWRAE
jgi:hypothetical protein